VLDVLDDAVGDAASAGGRESEAVASARKEGTGVERGNCRRVDRKVWRRERMAAQERGGAMCFSFRPWVCGSVDLSHLRVEEPWRWNERLSEQMYDSHDERCEGKFRPVELVRAEV
jgi:hypothetical protein